MSAQKVLLLSDSFFPLVRCCSTVRNDFSFETEILFQYSFRSFFLCRLVFHDKRGDDKFFTTNLGKKTPKTGSVAMTVNGRRRRSDKFTINYVRRKMRLGWGGFFFLFYDRPTLLKKRKYRYLWHVGSRLICSPCHTKSYSRETFSASECWWMAMMITPNYPRKFCLAFIRTVRSFLLYASTRVLSSVNNLAALSDLPFGFEFSFCFCCGAARDRKNFPFFLLKFNSHETHPTERKPEDENVFHSSRRGRICFPSHTILAAGAFRSFFYISFGDGLSGSLFCAPLRITLIGFVFKTFFLASLTPFELVRAAESPTETTKHFKWSAL